MVSPTYGNVSLDEIVRIIQRKVESAEGEYNLMIGTDSQNFDTTKVKLGDVLTVNDLELDLENGTDWLDVIGTSKGKGFQGVVKRHGFGGVGGTTHGQHNRLRHPGSLGASSWPSRVFPGMRMAGHMGNERVKVINLEVVKLIPESNLIVVKGSVPGAKGSYVIVED